MPSFSATLSLCVSNFFQLSLLILLVSSCHPRSTLFEPRFEYCPPKQCLQALPSAFEPLEPDEVSLDWGKELKIGNAFANEQDFYRAITGYKRSLFLDSPLDRALQANFCQLQAYWLGGKYCEAIEIFESTSLHTVGSTFPPFRELLVILYDCYMHAEQEEKARAVITIMEKGDPETASDLKLYNALEKGHLATMQSLDQSDEMEAFIYGFTRCRKSIRTAQTLNAILPGAGYWYVGQKKSAVTSFFINAAFGAATYYFFKEGNWGAGMIAGSLEFGWYFGGINGAGLAAKQYNEWLYQAAAKDLMIQKRLFPVLMLETSF